MIKPTAPCAILNQPNKMISHLTRNHIATGLQAVAGEIQQRSRPMKQSAVLLVNSYAGHREIPITVIDQTNRSYHCELITDAMLPGRNNFRKKGYRFYAPKECVRFT